MDSIIQGWAYRRHSFSGGRAAGPAGTLLLEDLLIEDIEDCEAAGITPYVPKPDRSPARHSGHYMKSEFKYDATIILANR